MPVSLNPSWCFGGHHLSNIPLQAASRPLLPTRKSSPGVSSREPPSLLRALRPPEIVKPRNSASLPPIPTREPQHLAPGRASSRRAETRSRNAPEPLATPTLRLPRTEPKRATRGGGSPLGGGGGELSPDRKYTRTLRILNQPVNSRRLGPSDPLQDTPLRCPPASSTPPHLRQPLSSRCSGPGAQARSRTRAPGLGAWANGWAEPLRGR